MTTEPAYDDGPDDAVEPVTFGIPERDHSQDRVPFRLGDDDTILYAVRPKMAVLMKIAAGMTSAGELDQIAAFEGFIDHMMEPESVVYLRERLEDPDDDLDLDHLDEPMQHFMGMWFGRPTGLRAASARSQSRTGRRSTAKQRS